MAEAMGFLQRGFDVSTITESRAAPLGYRGIAALLSGFFHTKVSKSLCRGSRFNQVLNARTVRALPPQALRRIGITADLTIVAPIPPSAKAEGFLGGFR